MKKIFSRLAVVSACALAITAVTLKPVTVNNPYCFSNSTIVRGMPYNNTPIIYK